MRARRILGLLPVALAAVPAAAQQRDTIITRTVSSWQTDVDRLKQQLLSQRNLEAQLFRMLNEVESQKRAALPDSQAKFVAQSQMLFNRMREVSLQQGKLRRQIELLCETVRKPDGWLGVVTTGFQLEDKRTDGTKIIRFLEPPVVASVDPGSPAERVGVRAGDVLVEIGGQRVLQQNIIFADLLRPGKEIVLKLQRGDDMVTLTPTVEPLPEVTTTTSCSWVDPAMAYVIAPTPAQVPAMVRVQTGPNGEKRYAYTYARPRRDSSDVAAAAPVAVGGVFAGPMVSMFGGGANVLAGLQLIALSTESSRALGVSHGILVNAVLQGTPGREAGLQGGDILVSADSIDLRSVTQLQRVIRNASDKVVTLVIMRDKKRETLQLRW